MDTINTDYLVKVQWRIRVVLPVAVSRVAEFLHLYRIVRAVDIASGMSSLIMERYILVIVLPIKHELVASLERVLNFVTAEVGCWGGQVLGWCCWDTAAMTVIRMVLRYMLGWSEWEDLCEESRRLFRRGSCGKPR